MKKLLLLITSVFFSVSIMLGQSIEVGFISAGSPTLSLSDSELTSALSGILDGATLSSSEMRTGTYNSNSFYYIRTTATRPVNQISTMSIMLSQQGSILSFSSVSGCTMECQPNTPCSGCTQDILIPCQQQTCSCTSAGGSCTAKTTFDK